MLMVYVQHCAKTEAGLVKTKPAKQQTKQNCFLINVIFTELEIIEQSNHSV